ncbi:MAG TPA: hypothetical protein ENJ19_08545 [Gammaproteobacteria bacterium]|nr:hypothetical protein [Gammaproteobacteria bacterium]
MLAQQLIVTLKPRPATLRRLQHRIVARHQLVAESEGNEPQRRLVIHPRQTRFGAHHDTRAILHSPGTS